MKTALEKRTGSLKTYPRSLKSYEDLKRHVAELFLSGKKKVQEAIEREKIRTYWQIGKSIHQHVLESGKRADYGKQVIRRLSGDLKTNETLLYYALQFSKSYEELPASNKLSWSHYRALLPLKNESERAAWESKAEEWGWSSRALESALNEAKDAPLIPSRGSINLPEKIGQLYTYKVKKQEKKVLWIDLGFRSSFGIRSEFSTRYYEGDVIKSMAEGAAGYGITRVQSPRFIDLYNYKARFLNLEKDGTAWMDLDLGFNIRLERPLKLAGIESSPGNLKESLNLISATLTGAQNLKIRTIGPGTGGRLSCAIYLDERPLVEILKRKKRRVSVNEEPLKDRHG